ncbi:MAG: tripartite tricarboxylate transporter substrate-binding protein, partial [Phycisphaeraceae bacterium]
PGASGSIGTRGALQARPDGLTWTSGAAASLGTFRLLDLLDTSLDDWHLFLAVANVAILSVPADSPYEDFGQFLEAMKEKPGEVRIATAGVASSGHHAMETLAQATGTEYRHVSYPGGNPAVIATVGGETDATPQLATEQAEMIRGKRLRPLAVLASQPLELEGYGTVPAVTDWLPDLHYAPNYFGIWVNKDAPPEVIETMESVWEEHIKNSEALQRYARNQGAFFTPYYGEDARERTMEKVKEDAWSLHEAGQAKMSPEELGIPRPGTKL